MCLYTVDSDMSQISITHYLQLLERLWRGHDGSVLAGLLSLRHDHVSSSHLHGDNPDAMVYRFLEPPIDEIVISHLKCLSSLVNNKSYEAYNHQSNMIQLLTKVIQSQKEENWCLPVMYSVCLDLRLVAQKSENDRSDNKETSGEILEKAAECLLGCFRVCAADNRCAEEDTKRIGMLTLVNQLFKVYFRINKLHLCRPLIRAIESSPFKASFSLSQQVTYNYFVGRKSMYDSNYRSAAEHLSFAFENCHKASKKNKRLILIYLIPVKVLLGYLPKKQLLEKFDLMQFWELVQAVRSGNLSDLNDVLEKYESFFIKSGIYLITENLKIIAYRNLFRRVYLALDTHQIPVEALQCALRVMGYENSDINETQCIVANLIYDGKIKGYISYQHRKLVVSKQNPFPALNSIS